MAGFRQHIHDLLETDRYNLSILDQLQGALHEQVKQGWYDVDINLAILKLYQFHPQDNVVNVEVILKILIKALMNLPSTDFQLCMFLIPEKFQKIDAVMKIAMLAEKLDGSRFKDFWSKLASFGEDDRNMRNMGDSNNNNNGSNRLDVESLVPGFEKSIRMFIFETISLTYKEMPRKALAESLNVEVLDKFIDTKSEKAKAGEAERRKADLVLIAKPNNKNSKNCFNNNTVISSEAGEKSDFLQLSEMQDLMSVLEQDNTFKKNKIKALREQLKKNPNKGKNRKSKPAQPMQPHHENVYE